MLSTSSFIIPTLNRPKDLEITLDSILELANFPNEVIIVDQSDNNTTEKLCKQKKYINLNIVYHRFEIKSGALARNYAIDNLDEKSEIVVFLDDDVTIEKDFLNQIKIFFENNRNAKGGVANIHSPTRQIGILKKIGFFLLTGNLKFKDFFVTSGGFNTIPIIQPEIIQQVERTSGCGMFFRKSVFDEGLRFEKKFMKYSLMEDCFLSYTIQQKYPKSLFFVPTVKMIHHESPVGRIANKSKIYQNIIHRFYFIQKFKKKYSAYLRTMFIFCIFDLIIYKKIAIISLYIKGLTYVSKNKDKITKPDFNFNDFIFQE